MSLAEVALGGSATGAYGFLILGWLCVEPTRQNGTRMALAPPTHSEKARTIWDGVLPQTPNQVVCNVESNKGPPSKTTCFGGTCISGW